MEYTSSNQFIASLLDKYYDDARSEDFNRVISRLVSFVSEWLLSKRSRNQAKILTLGSQRYGVYSKQYNTMDKDDMDLLVIGPSGFNHKDFFCGIQPILENLAPPVDPNDKYEEKSEMELSQFEVTALRFVQDARIPLIKFNLQNTKIDLLYCRYPIEGEIPDKFYMDMKDPFIRSFDEQSIQSLNGLVDTEIILQTVPDENQFRQLLKFIKLWAKKKKNIL